MKQNETVAEKQELVDDPQLAPAVQAYYADKRLFHRNIFFLLFGTFGMGLALGVAGNLVPLHMDRVGMNATQIALGFSINGWLIAFLMITSPYWCLWCRGCPGRCWPPSAPATACSAPSSRRASKWCAAG